MVLRVRHKVDPWLVAHASVVVTGVQIFFLCLVNFAAHPFALVSGTIPPDGNGLNPLLQYPEMVIHPPMLYLGYVGMTVPFAFGLAALITKYPGEKWIHITRRWTMFLSPRKEARRFPADFIARRSPTANILADLVKRAIDSRELKEDDAWEVALSISAEAHGLIILYLAQRFDLPENKFRALYRRSLRRLLDGISI